MQCTQKDVIPDKTYFMNTILSEDDLKGSLITLIKYDDNKAKN